MNIHCPQCDYERHVDDDKLPASAYMATCPKCAHRFQFRDCVTPNAGIASGIVTSTSACTDRQEDLASTPAADAVEVINVIGKQGQPEIQENISEASKMAPEAQKNEAEVQKNLWDDLSSTVNRWDSKQNTQTGSPNVPSKESQKNHGQSSNSSHEQPVDNIIPWENLGVYTFFQGLMLTIKHAATSPASFFSTMVGKEPLSRPLTFFVLLGVFQSLIDRLWYATLTNTLSSFTGDAQLQTLMESVSHDTNVFVTLLVSPFMLTLQVFILSGLYYLMFRFVRPDKAVFSNIFRIMCYAAAPTVICVIPVIGPIVASFLYLIWTFIGCKHGLQLPWSRIFMALAPLYLLGLALLLQVTLMVINSLFGL